jgi:hypothetical protein
MGGLTLYSSVQGCGQDETPEEPLVAGIGGNGGQSPLGGQSGSQSGGKGGKSGAGQGGKSGTGAQSGTGGTINPEGIPPWVIDPEMWQEVLAYKYAWPKCHLYEPKPGVELPDEGWSWTACGPGCEVAELVRDGRPGLSGLGGEQRNGEKAQAIIKWSRYWKEQDIQLLHLSDLETGKPLLATRQHGCSEGNRNGRIPLYLVYRGYVDGVTVHLSAYPDFEQKRFWWSEPFEKAPVGGGGTLLTVVGHPGTNILNTKPLVKMNYSSPMFEVLDPAPLNGDGGYSGDLAVYIDHSTTPPHIRGWSDDGLGLRPVVDGIPGVTQRVAVGGKFIAGIIGKNQEQDHYMTEEARLWWTPRTKTLTGEKPLLSPPLPHLPQTISDDLAVAGDFILFTYWEPLLIKSTRYFFHTPTQQLWRYVLSMSTEEQRMDRLYFSTDEFLVVGRREKTDADQQIRYIYRYKLSEISSWAEPVAWD